MSAKVITPQELKTLLDKGEAVLIDVREPGEYKDKSIPGALNVPLGNLDPEALKGLEGKTIVVHCQAGNRSAKAAEKLGACKLEICDLKGGIQNWENSGMNVCKDAKCARLPLMRQVQLTIGLFVIAGCLLTYFVNPSFLIIPFIMGLGLTNAGLTGWCGLAKFMGLMPWNR